MAIKFTTLLAGGVQTEEPVLSREELKGLTVDADTEEGKELWDDVSRRIERLFKFYYQLIRLSNKMNNKQTDVGQELVDRLQNMNKMLDAIRSAEVDELELPEINEHNKSTVKPQKLPKRNETNR